MAKQNRLTVCMIAKNEEKNIGDALDSVKGLADEVIVLIDEASSDKTKEIAESKGAKTFSHKWTYSFSDARNESIKKATGDWILVLDADERISERDHKKIKISLAQEDVDAYYLIQRNYSSRKSEPGWMPANTDNYPESEGHEGFISNPFVRLFRNDSEYRFRNIIHETIEESILEAGGTIKNLLIPIHHYGTLVLDEEKKKNYLSYGLMQIKKTPNDPKPYFDVGKLYLYFKDYDNAEKMFVKTVALKPTYRNVLNNLAQIFVIKREYDKAIVAYKENLAHKPNDVQTLINLGVIQMRKQDYDSAEKNLKKAIEGDSMSVPAYDNLIALFVQKNELDRAVKTAKLAYRMTKVPRFAKTVLHITKNYEGVPTNSAELEQAPDRS